jgi:glycosyltransferase involved in cell wall biosynthesis
MMSGPEHAPKVTVIVPAYNVADYILPCLQSVVSQTWANLDCIVVDDGSADATAAHVEALADSRIRLIRQPNAGVSAARNNGFSASDGDYVMFLDGDDALHPTAIERLIARLSAQPDAVASFGTFLKILPGGGPYPGQKPLAQHLYPDGDILAAMLRGNFLANGGHVLIRRSAAEAVGGFDARLRLSEDWEYWCRLALQGHFAFIGNEPEVFYLRVRPGSSSGGLSVDWNNHLPCLAAIASNPDIRARFDRTEWRGIERSMRAAQMWEAGRVNFTMRHFG